jgi:uncharacterized lipoprotein YehR (DUF1307 family)
MRAMQVNEVKETQEEVKVSIKVKEKIIEEVEEKTTGKRTDEWKEKLGRKKVSKEDKATERVTLNFTKNEVMTMEKVMIIEGIDKDNKNAKALFIKKMLQRQMLRNGYEF